MLNYVYVYIYIFTYQYIMLRFHPGLDTGELTAVAPSCQGKNRRSCAFRAGQFPFWSVEN